MVGVIAKTYAEALFAVALETNQVDQFGKELDFILDVFKQHSDFYEFYKTPLIGNEDKKQVVENVFKGKLSSEILNFLKILSDKGRTSFIDGIVEGFHAFVNAHQNIVEAVAVTVRPLKDEDKVVLTAKLSKMTGKNIVLSNEIDPSIIGGMLVRIGDRVIDGTVQSRLNKLKENFAQIIV